MKQLTIRLDDEMENELKEVQDMLSTKSGQGAMVHCLRSYRWLCDSERVAEKKLEEAQAVIKYLEEQLRKV